MSKFYSDLADERSSSIHVSVLLALCVWRCRNAVVTILHIGPLPSAVPQFKMRLNCFDSSHIPTPSAPLISMRRRKNIEDLDSEDPIDTIDQDLLIDVLHKDELKKFHVYKKYLIAFLLLQTPFTVYWKQLRKEFPALCLLSLFSIIISVSTIHFNFNDLRNNVARATKSKTVAKLVQKQVFQIVNAIICFRLLVSVLKNDLMWRVFFLLPVVDFLICLSLNHWHEATLLEIKQLSSLKYNYKTS